LTYRDLSSTQEVSEVCRLVRFGARSHIHIAVTCLIAVILSGTQKVW